MRRRPSLHPAVRAGEVPLGEHRNGHAGKPFGDIFVGENASRRVRARRSSHPGTDLLTAVAGAGEQVRPGLQQRRAEFAALDEGQKRAVEVAIDAIRVARSGGRFDDDLAPANFVVGPVGAAVENASTRNVSSSPLACAIGPRQAMRESARGDDGYAAAGNPSIACRIAAPSSAQRRHARQRRSEDVHHDRHDRQVDVAQKI